MYIVTTIDLIQAIQKQPARFATTPLQEKSSSGLATNVNGEEGHWGLSMENIDAVRESLKPGKHLDAMNRDMVSNVQRALNRLAPEKTSRTIGLLKWLRHAITEASTNSIYGPENPEADARVAQAFWYVWHGVPKKKVIHWLTVTTKGLPGRFYDYSHGFHALNTRMEGVSRS